MGTKSFLVIVTTPEIYKIFIELKSLFQSLQGLQIMAGPDHCEMRGELLRLSDWLKIAQLQAKHRHHCQFKASIHNLVQTEVKTHLESLVKNRQLAPPTFLLDSEAKVLITKDRQENFEQYKELFSQYGLQIQMDSSRVNLSPLVRVKLFLAEVDRNWSRQIGVNWSQDYQAKVLPTHSIEGQLLGQLQMMENSGKAKVLAAPTLLCVSGGNAEFLAGGEFPIRLSGYHKQKVEWKKYGIMFSIKPIADHSGQMRIDLNTEVSMLDSSSQVDEVPGLKVSRLKTQFNLRKKQIIALSGLIHARTGSGSAGLPFLKKIPILGHLFQSQSFQNEKTELIVFVQPEVLGENQLSESVQFPQMNDLPHEH